MTIVLQVNGAVEGHYKYRSRMAAYLGMRRLIGFLDPFQHRG